MPVFCVAACVALGQSLPEMRITPVEMRASVLDDRVESRFGGIAEEHSGMHSGCAGTAQLIPLTCGRLAVSDIVTLRSPENHSDEDGILVHLPVIWERRA